MSLVRTLVDILDAGGDVKLSAVDIAVSDSANISRMAQDQGGLVVYNEVDSLPITNLSSGQTGYVKSSSRYYISDGVGWYSIPLASEAPFWITEPNDSYAIADSVTPLVIIAKIDDSDTPSNLVIDSSFASDSAQYLVDITVDSSVYTFTPLSSDSVHANVTAGNIPDSNGGQFTYTFKFGDGVSYLTKAVTIDYSGIGIDPAILSVDWNYGAGAVNEGGTATFRVATEGCPDGYRVYYKLTTNSTVDPATDFTTNTGTVLGTEYYLTISNNAVSRAYGIKSDQSYPVEGTETIQVEITKLTDNNGTLIQSYSLTDTINVNDSSTYTPSTLVYTVESATITTSGLERVELNMGTNNSLNELLTLREQLRAVSQVTNPNSSGNKYQVVFMLGNKAQWGFNITDTMVTPKFRGWGLNDTALSCCVKRWNNGDMGIHFGVRSQLIDASMYINDGVQSLFSVGSTTTQFSFDRIRVYNSTGNTVTFSIHNNLVNLATASSASTVHGPSYTTNMVAFIDAGNYCDVLNRFYNMGSRNPESYGSMGGSGYTVSNTAGPNSKPVIEGTTASTADFNGTGSNAHTYFVANSYTFHGVAAYKASGGTNRRIFQGTTYNWLSGWWAGRTGVAFHNGWITSSSNYLHGNNFFYTTDQEDLFRSLGVSRTTGTGGMGASNSDTIRINLGRYTSETSDFRFVELLMYDAQISSTNYTSNESYLATKYSL